MRGGERERERERERELVKVNSLAGRRWVGGQPDAEPVAAKNETERSFMMTERGFMIQFNSRRRIL